MIKKIYIPIGAVYASHPSKGLSYNRSSHQELIRTFNNLIQNKSSSLHPSCRIVFLAQSFDRGQYVYIDSENHTLSTHQLISQIKKMCIYPPNQNIKTQGLLCFPPQENETSVKHYFIDLNSPRVLLPNTTIRSTAQLVYKIDNTITPGLHFIQPSPKKRKQGSTTAQQYSGNLFNQKQLEKKEALDRAIAFELIQHKQPQFIKSNPHPQHNQLKKNPIETVLCKELYGYYRRQNYINSLFDIIHPHTDSGQRHYPRWQSDKAPLALSENQFWRLILTTAFHQSPGDNKAKIIHYLMVLAGIRTGLVAHEWDSSNQCVITKVKPQFHELIR